MKFLLVSNSPIQNSYFEKFLRDNNFEFKSICGETVSPYNKKNASNLDFFSQIQRAIFFGNSSLNSFSYYHSLKVRRFKFLFFIFY